MNVFDVAAATQAEHMCARRASLAHTHTWERATVNHVRVSGFEQRRGLLRVRGDGRRDGRTDRGRKKSLARPRFNLTVLPLLRRKR